MYETYFFGEYRPRVSNQVPTLYKTVLIAQGDVARWHDERNTARQGDEGAGGDPHGQVSELHLHSGG